MLKTYVLLIHFILKSLIFRDSIFFINMFKTCIIKTCIRSLLEYRAIVWSPYTLKDIDCIKCVQRYFMCCIPG